MWYEEFENILTLLIVLLIIVSLITFIRHRVISNKQDALISLNYQLETLEAYLIKEKTIYNHLLNLLNTNSQDHSLINKECQFLKIDNGITKEYTELKEKVDRINLSNVQKKKMKIFIDSTLASLNRQKKIAYEFSAEKLDKHLLSNSLMYNLYLVENLIVETRINTVRLRFEKDFILLQEKQLSNLNELTKTRL
ncbi:hypothetical protein CR205_11165 [Alteribacter lacisalsi]|uniref:Uncharacterized protein n=1 Tax=Alteribacter lacisalsi TaxID=2045244 RepID=A0A2W0HDU2_9BACI|nr:hypothetical protein [Alteribacter lacisalsi]PYZ99086.1 hypothetical protein CR205_11165 [Alteribacter lacisalsi]